MKRPPKFFSLLAAAALITAAAADTSYAGPKRSLSPGGEAQPPKRIPPPGPAPQLHVPPANAAPQLHVPPADTAPPPHVPPADTATPPPRSARQHRHVAARSRRSRGSRPGAHVCGTNS